MRYFLDTEFIENGSNQPIYLISIGIVSEDGRQLYAVNSDCPLELAGDWVKENVLPNLNQTAIPLVEIKKLLISFCDPIRYGRPEFWGYFADYDWVVFCQIFGRMIDLPKNYPMFCRDLKQWSKDLGDIELPKQSSKEHNALNDARWNKQSWEFLRNCQLTGSNV